MNQALRNLLFSAACVGFAFVANACTNGYGDPCELPDAQQVELACQPIDGGGFCVFDQAADCESSLCATLDGRDPFCTERCETNDDCDANSTCHFATIASSQGVCVPNQD